MTVLVQNRALNLIIALYRSTCNKPHHDIRHHNAANRPENVTRLNDIRSRHDVIHHMIFELDYNIIIIIIDKSTSNGFL